MPNPPTIKEIAKRLNLAASTVSRALHNHPRIGLKTRMQVQALARELQYEPNQTAIFFQQKKHLPWVLYSLNCQKPSFPQRSAA